jgi:hypothetical protein
MADTKISDLTAATTVDPADLLTTVQGGTNKKAVRSLLQTYAAGTLTTHVKVQEHSATWNNAAVTFTGWDLNVTDTASNASSLLLDLRVGGVSKLRVTKGGVLNLFTGTQNMNLRSSGDHIILAPNGTDALGVSKFAINSMPSTGVFGFTSSTSVTATPDAAISRSAAGVLAVSTGSGAGNGAALEFAEQTAPAAPSANRVRLYAQDNGGGKTQLMALFATGAAQQVAIEP